MISGLRVFRVCYGPLPIFICNIAGFLNACALLFGVLTVAMSTFTRFMFVCVWKRMRQMDDNLIVRIATIQAIVLSLLFTSATLFQINLGIVKSIGVQVSFSIASVSLLDKKKFQWLNDVNQLLIKLCFRCVLEICINQIPPYKDFQ